MAGARPRRNKGVVVSYEESEISEDSERDSKRPSHDAATQDDPVDLEAAPVTDYERRRQENILRNEAYLRSVGLGKRPRAEAEEKQVRGKVRSAGDPQSTRTERGNNSRHEEAPAVQLPELEAEALFDLLDVEGQGLVTTQTIIRRAESLHVPLAVDMVQSMIDLFDRAGKGGIDAADLGRILSHSTFGHFLAEVGPFAQQRRTERPRDKGKAGTEGHADPRGQ